MPLDHVDPRALRGGWRRHLGKLRLGIALALAAGLYWLADWREVARTLWSADPRPLCVAMLLFVPQTVVSAWRWQSLVQALARISLPDAVRHTLAASTLNLLLPSKAGDLAKGLMLPGAARPRAVGCSVLEKLADAGTLAAFLVLGTWGFTAAGSIAVALLATTAASIAVARMGLVDAHGRKGGGAVDALNKGLWFTLQSFLLWGLHLAQIRCFLEAAGVLVDSSILAARIPAAIFAGMIPISLCGVGTRDSALVWLFADVASAPTMVAVGTMMLLRYLLPGAAGIPFLPGSLVRRGGWMDHLRARPPALAAVEADAPAGAGKR